MATNDNILIQVSGLKKHYNKGAIKALDGVDIDIRKGDVVVVIGPSGSGKSTFLRCLNMLEIPSEGDILFEDANLTSDKVDLNLHRQKMGMVFQQFNLFPHLTILDNLTLAPMMLKKLPKAKKEKK